MTDIELLWQLAEIREISRQQVRAQVEPLLILAEAYQGLVEMLLDDKPEFRADLERMKNRWKITRRKHLTPTGNRGKMVVANLVTLAAKPFLFVRITPQSNYPIIVRKVLTRLSNERPEGLPVARFAPVKRVGTLLFEGNYGKA